MANLMKLEFVALDISGKNYLSWVLDAEIHLDAMGLGDTIKEKNKASNQENAKAMIFLRHHLDEALKIEYLTIKDPLILWKNLKESSNIETNLIAHLLVTEQNNDLLMKNHENRPTGAAPFLEVNEVYAHYSRRGKSRGLSRGHGRARDSGLGRGSDNGQGRNSALGVNHSSKKNHYQRGKKNDDRHEVPEARDSENKCHRCGGSGHWSRTCRTAKHLVELYQASMKR
ncbi:uncharacterized protein LOC132613191 [Lycium barbarum]|uniref:uncharacterized protein LOC132613191 n=1 Tax=Lycium barbarum TaxID=112863 RepID=UPI00293EB7A8|nr:uncharacterized protein LOC132613191 [Lycium barbarum]